MIGAGHHVRHCERVRIASHRTSGAITKPACGVVQNPTPATKPSHATSASEDRSRNRKTSTMVAAASASASRAIATALRQPVDEEWREHEHEHARERRGVVADHFAGRAPREQRGRDRERDRHELEHEVVSPEHLERARRQEDLERPAVRLTPVEDRTGAVPDRIRHQPDDCLVAVRRAHRRREDVHAQQHRADERDSEDDPPLPPVGHGKRTTARTGRWSDGVSANTSPLTSSIPPRTSTWSIWLCGRCAGRCGPAPGRCQPGNISADRRPPEVEVARDDLRAAVRRADAAAPKRWRTGASVARPSTTCAARRPRRAVPPTSIVTRARRREPGRVRT